jgi:hypothetical protein
MPRTKQITVQAAVDGKVIFDRTIAGKSKLRELTLEAMAAVDSVGGTAIIRRQTVGAKGWALFAYAAGDKAAVMDQALVWEVV